MMETMALEQAVHGSTEPDEPALGIRRIWAAKDGTPILLRAIEHGDLDIERELVERLSSHSRYMRLMSARKPTEDEMIRWTRIDRRREGAVIATIWAGGRERLIGVARYAMDEGETDVVECAIVIDDVWQQQGLGRVLLSRLIELARRSGMRQMVGTMLTENDAMKGLARSIGFTLSHQPGSAFVTDLRLDLATRRGA
ncbi:GNAT family N-acetyltransferase [Burkholderia cepacia]|uniref:GNAT family N-acetyltransferase n=1 Tax=Burkholderia cepacia TaxID=292 RepID=UPI00249ED536|nr:GNAT family N-acetyltransferase [Burkholderia cepacia]WGY66957.1 GNAT family N-acetyltransferase [Burkholderia cepacia]